MRVNPEQDTSMQLLIGNFLRIGVTTSAMLVLCGGILHLIQNWHKVPQLSHFSGEPASLTNIPNIFHGALHGNPLFLIQSGLVVLLFTPIIRVGLSVLLFALEKDYLYVGITVIVMLFLLFSLLGNVAI